MMIVYLVSIIEKERYEKKKKLLLWPKEKRKRIMVSEFLTLFRRLCVFDFIFNYQYLQDKD